MTESLEIVVQSLSDDNADEYNNDEDDAGDDE